MVFSFTLLKKMYMNNVPICRINALNEFDNKNTRNDYITFVNVISKQINDKFRNINTAHLPDFVPIELQLKSTTLILKKFTDEINQDKKQKFYLWIDETDILDSNDPDFDKIYMGCFKDSPMIDRNIIFFLISFTIIPKGVPMTIIEFEN